jgi:ABC-2 type transport system ATP-binding protein
MGVDFTVIQVDRITKRYTDTVAVDGLSFQVQKGEILGLLGPNGAGKTTTMRILTGYLTADTGKVNIAGCDIPEHSLAARRHVGYLPENNPLYPDMDVISYLSFIGAMRGLSRQSLHQRVDQVVSMTGLEMMAHKLIGELSKGYCQRVGLAQAIIHDPDILILDEPTVGLDPNQIVEIRSLIRSFGREKTIILSSHILPEVSATCSRIIILNRGKLAGSGTPDEMAVRARGGNSVTCVLKGPVEVMTEKLRAHINIRGVEYQGEEGEGRIRFRVITDPGVDIRESLFQMAVDNHWMMTELYRESLTLEEVFQHLTTEEGIS